MTDASAIPTIDAVADSVTKQTYDETKSLADERGAENASLKARLEHYQTLDRAQLKEWSSGIETHIKTLAENAAPDAKAHYRQMEEWARNVHERDNVEQQMPLARTLWGSAQALQMVTANASVHSATAEELSKSKRRGEELEAELETSRRRTGELNNSLEEMQKNYAELQTALEKAGLEKEKFNFSKATSREADAPNTEEVDLTLKTENASKVPAVMRADPAAALFKFVNAAGGMASSRFTPTVSSHQLLGVAQATETSIGAALRPMAM
jgi:hypothetical protein